MADIDDNTTGGDENIELKDITQFEDEEDGDHDETSFEENNRLEELTDVYKETMRHHSRDPNTSIVAPQGFNPNLEEENKIRKLEEKKKFLREYLSLYIDESDGPHSAKLLNNIKLRVGKKGKLIGITWKGRKIIVSVKDGYGFSKDAQYKDVIKDFNDHYGLAQEERYKTFAGEIEQQLNAAAGGKDEKLYLSRDDISSVISVVEDKLDDRLTELGDDLEVRRGELSKAEVDAIIGVLSFDRLQNISPEEQIKSLENAELPHWRDELKEAEKENKDSVRMKQLKGVVEILEIKSDVIRIRNNIKPETDMVKELIGIEAKIGDICRLRRFAKWARGNILGISSVVISAVGGLVTIIIAARGAARVGATATRKVPHALSEVAKKVAPVVGAVLNIIGGALRYGAMGLNWISNNLWAFALLIA